MNPSVGRMVHYVSYGTPGGEYTSQCRAAVIASLPKPWSDTVDLVVFNPEGLFFNKECPFGEPLTDGTSEVGTWHWPERVEE
jgi:hypothetical protein